MSREALITLNCKRYSERIVDIVSLFIQSGWRYYNSDNKIAYLPLGSDDDFDWQKDNFSVEKLYEIIEEKQEKKELVGLILYFKKSNEGITILAKNTKEIVISLDINRKAVEDSRDSVTDIGWYFRNIIQKFKENGCPIDYIKFEEYSD